MSILKNLFGSLFGSNPKPQRPTDKPVSSPEATQAKFEGPLSKGEVIGGKYEIRGVLGRGGFGVVYLALNQQTGELQALKTFRDELVADAAAREAFKKEALLWVALGEHPFILSARWVEEIANRVVEEKGRGTTTFAVRTGKSRLFVAMDYVAPDERKRVTLTDHLALTKGPLETKLVLRWAAEFCQGMEHAQKCGVRCHRDIKPGNILITPDGLLKISDFGLAVAGASVLPVGSGAMPSANRSEPAADFGFSVLMTEGRRVCGTPGYIAPEVFNGTPADVRSDIYSFGLVLWQMAAGSSTPPFSGPYRGDLGGYLKAIHDQQIRGALPPVPGLLGPVIARSLAPDPAQRFADFSELGREMERLYREATGSTLDLPKEDLSAAALSNQASSLAALGRHQEALACFDRALAVDPRCLEAWNNKGGLLADLGRYEEAIACYDRALAVNPRYVMALRNRGFDLGQIGRHEEAIACFDAALAIDPNDALALFRKAQAEEKLERFADASRDYDQFLLVADPTQAAEILTEIGIAVGRLTELDSMSQPEGSKRQTKSTAADDTAAWFAEGLSLYEDDLDEEALECFEQVLAVDPRHTDAWHNKGCCLARIGRHEEAIICYDRAMAISPGRSWFEKGNALRLLERYEEAIGCYDKALEIDRNDPRVWANRGIGLEALGRRAEALSCYDQMVACAPEDPKAWFNKALAEDTLNHATEAVRAWRKYLTLAPPEHAPQIEHAKKRLLELEKAQ